MSQQSSKFDERYRIGRKDGPGLLTFTNDNSGFTGQIQLNDDLDGITVTVAPRMRWLSAATD